MVRRARIAERVHRPVLLGVSTGVCSAFTMLCGAAQSFWQLALCRTGVGLGEGGSGPISYSLIIDRVAWLCRPPLPALGPKYPTSGERPCDGAKLPTISRPAPRAYFRFSTSSRTARAFAPSSEWFSAIAAKASR
jgi:hypothetical protein